MKSIKSFRFIFILLFISLLFNSCYVARFFYWNFADINDYKKFQYLEVKKPDVPFTFKKSIKGMNFDTLTYNGKLYKFDDFFDKNKCVAFLIIRNDSILYEKYFNGRNEESFVPSFSAAKSFVSALVGIAIGEGKIKNVDQSITDYLPELLKADERFSKITIKDLLNMRSGILFTESYLNPFGNVAKSYYGRNLLAQMNILKIKEDPDKRFDYVSMNTQLLSFIVERATGKKLPDYLDEKIWQPLGMEYDATWSIDSKKHKEAKAFCGLNARARDFAKFGRLYLNKGNWNGKQIVPEDWVDASTTVNKTTQNFFYTYQWWHNVERKNLSDTINKNGISRISTYTDKDGKTFQYLQKPMNDFFANGLLGQFIYVYPEKNVIIVRLGKNSKVNWPKLFNKIAKEL
jgi:CubicO group peptidase (beta-lactamase class C family)